MRKGSGEREKERERNTHTHTHREREREKVMDTDIHRKAEVVDSGGVVAKSDR